MMQVPPPPATGKDVPSSRKKVPMALIPVIGMAVIGSIFAWYFSPLHQNSNASAKGSTILTGHVPALLKQSTELANTAPDTPISISLGLRLRNQTDLDNYVQTMNRADLKARTYLTSDQILKTFAPLPETEQAVISYMQQQGFTVTQTYKNHMLVSFRGTVRQAESAFQVQINTYRSPDGTTFYAPTTEPSLPSELAPFIQSIGGLSNATHLTHPPIQSTTPMAPTTGAKANATTAQGCPGQSPNYFLPGQTALAYNLTGLYNNGFQGEGQTVALFELDDFVASDVTAYAACYGGSSVPIKRIPVTQAIGDPQYDGKTEVALDIDLVLSAAPHLAALNVYVASNDQNGVLANWAAIVNDAVPVVSTSWGACEQALDPALIQQENSFFTVAVAQGQSILASSGDTGTDACRGVSQQLGNPPSVNDPASQPYVTGVGGTELTINADNSYNTEKVWNTTYNNQTTASGGGISTVWTLPDWQKAPGLPDTTYSSGAPCKAATGKYCREVPDVSLHSSPSQRYLFYCTPGACKNNGWMLASGTSAAAPLWAAMIALTNQKSLHDGYFNLGFLNPLLYQISQDPTMYSADFHDVTVGNNDGLKDGKNIYPATVGYDMATGLGSFNATALANDLIQQAANQTRNRRAPASTTWYFAEGSVGNGFREFLTVLNPSAMADANFRVTYLFSNKDPIKVMHSVKHGSRITVSVNDDIKVQVGDPQQDVSAIVLADNPLVVERPMYFNLRGISSGTDVVGATNAISTHFYFAEGDTRHDNVRNYYTFVTMLNPSQIESASVVIRYYSNGQLAGTENITIPPMHRATGSPGNVGIHGQVAIAVKSDIGLVTERPLYFSDTIPTAGGPTTGAASAIGATMLGTDTGSDWLFAEGYTGTNFQEYLVLANFTDTDTTANVKLEYTNGTIQTVPVLVKSYSQTYFDVNNAYAHPISNCGCTPTTSVSAEVTTPTPSIVAERLMYFHFGRDMLSGGTDAVGEMGPSKNTAYTFAEGYTNTGFSEFLTLQNPNDNAETVAITMFSGSTVLQLSKQLPAHSRTTVSVNDLIAPMARAYPNSASFEVSIAVQVLGSTGSVVVERPIYFNFRGNIGGTDVIGYVGG